MSRPLVVRKNPRLPPPRVEEIDPTELGLLQQLIVLLKNTFVSVRTAKCEQTIRLVCNTTTSDAVSDATTSRDGAAGSALLNEVRMRLGLDVVQNRENLKRLLVLGLRQLRMPVRSVGHGPRAPLCASLRVCGRDPPEARILTMTLRRWERIPMDVVERIEKIAGGLWWARRRWDGCLPPPSSKMLAFSADVPQKLLKLFRRVACHNRCEFTFSSGAKVYVEWGPSNQLWMRGTNLLPFVTLLRCERQAQRRPGAASVLSVRGAGDVLV